MVGDARHRWHDADIAERLKWTATMCFASPTISEGGGNEMVVIQERNRVTVQRVVAVKILLGYHGVEEPRSIR